MLKNEDFVAFKLSYVKIIMLINVKMSTIVGILTYMNMIYFVLITLKCNNLCYFNNHEHDTVRAQLSLA